jgi:hypothetical protein
MPRHNRIAVTVSEGMRVALDVLAERNGLPLSTQAMVLLRQSLDRTMSSDAVQSRLARHRAERTAAEWREETQVDHIVETAHAEVTRRAQSEN